MCVRFCSQYLGGYDELSVAAQCHADAPPGSECRAAYPDWSCNVQQETCRTTPALSFQEQIFQSIFKNLVSSVHE